MKDLIEKFSQILLICNISIIYCNISTSSFFGFVYLDKVLLFFLGYSQGSGLIYPLASVFHIDRILSMYWNALHFFVWPLLLYVELLVDSLFSALQTFCSITSLSIILIRKLSFSELLPRFSAVILKFFMFLTFNIIYVYSMERFSLSY